MSRPFPANSCANFVCPSVALEWVSKRSLPVRHVLYGTYSTPIHTLRYVLSSTVIVRTYVRIRGMRSKPRKAGYLRNGFGRFAISPKVRTTPPLWFTTMIVFWSSLSDWIIHARARESSTRTLIDLQYLSASSSLCRVVSRIGGRCTYFTVPAGMCIPCVETAHT